MKRFETEGWDVIKLRKVELKGFRGARFPFALELGKEPKSIAIFGENAAGKSSIAEALEWFFYDRVEYLWKEDCKEEALRHIALGPTDLAEVRIEFSDLKLNSAKRLNAVLRSTYTNTSSEFDTYLQSSQTEKLVLGNAYLLALVLQTKSQKRDEIARIIGFDVLKRFREVIQRSLTWAKDDSQYAEAKGIRERCKSKLLEKFGKVPRKQSEYFEIANDRVMKFKLGKKITDEVSYEECLEALKGKITDPKRGQKLAALNTLRTGFEEFQAVLTHTRQNAEEFLASYKKLMGNVQKLSSIDLVEFLSKGIELIEKKRVGKDECPFCLEPFSNLAHLFDEVKTRIGGLETASKEHQALKKSKDSLVKELRAASTDSGTLIKQAKSLSLQVEIINKFESYKGYADLLADDISQKFAKLEPLEEVKEYKKKASELLSATEEGLQAVQASIKSLATSRRDEELIETRDDLIHLRTNFTDLQDSSETIKVCEGQIRSLSIIYDEFIKTQNKAFQDVLDRMSDDISKFYLELHPHEQIDKIRLKIFGEQGVEFSYLFHEKEVRPPRKYLSESHLNSLGIALFLASIKLFNRRSRYFVLDDVVTSFDINHRLRLLSLLKENFPDHQIIILTHEPEWFEMIKKDMPAAEWLFAEVDWSYDSGISIKRALRNQREVITSKLSQHLEVGNDLRKLLEMELKEIAFHLDVRVAFRFNDRNERREVGELLSALRGTVNKKSSDVKSNAVWQRLETCGLLASKNSHHPGIHLGKGEIQTIIEDIDKLQGLFLCPACGTYVSTKKFSQKDKQVYCSCGRKDLPWND